MLKLQKDYLQTMHWLLGEAVTQQRCDLWAKYFRFFRETLGGTFGANFNKIEGGRVKNCLKIC